MLVVLTRASFAAKHHQIHGSGAILSHPLPSTNNIGETAAFMTLDGGSTKRTTHKFRRASLAKLCMTTWPQHHIARSVKTDSADIHVWLGVWTGALSMVPHHKGAKVDLFCKGRQHLFVVEKCVKVDLFFGVCKFPFDECVEIDLCLSSRPCLFENSVKVNDAELYFELQMGVLVDAAGVQPIIGSVSPHGCTRTTTFAALKRPNARNHQHCSTSLTGGF
mmetsp:Transcript_1427/g.3824  ORF Transcript_1427/g.3824 Transcript_1427/m.3824 type:complete len:220 (+) Transcript_1427:147-806(+)